MKLNEYLKNVLSEEKIRKRVTKSYQVGSILTRVNPGEMPAWERCHIANTLGVKFRRH